MNTSTIQYRMALIVAVAMQCDQITEFIFPPLISRGNVVNLNQVAIAEKEFTVPTLPLLLVE